MLEFSNLLSFFIVFVVGIGLGAIINSFRSNEKKNAHDLTQQLEASKQALKDYQNKITDHFVTTADLVNQLTEDYKAVYQHLAQGAQTLAIGDAAKQFEIKGALLSHELTPVTLTESNHTEENTASSVTNTIDPIITPPKDYAPKGSPNDRGTLSEDFGLKN